jgi:hypothetical protein
VSVIDWLMDGDPAIRWQVMADLSDQPADAVAVERSRVATEGWGARLLSLQGDDGQWGGGTYTPKWISTTYTLLLLRHLGLDPGSDQARHAIGLVRENVRWRKPHSVPFFSGWGETCVTGMVVALAGYFGEAGGDTDEVVDWLVGEQLEDGGWNCQAPDRSSRSSFHTTISVLEGLFDYQAAGGPGAEHLDAVRRRGEEYLLERQLFRSLSTGEVINPRWMLFSFPPRWHYDLLRGLDYMRGARDPDPRCEEAVTVVEEKQRSDGRWPLQNRHRGLEHFELEEGGGKPSRWNTLRALRVLRWFGRREPPGR